MSGDSLAFGILEPVEIPVQIEAGVAQRRPGLPESLQVSDNVDLALGGGLVQHSLTLGLHLLQLQLRFLELCQRSLCKEGPSKLQRTLNSVSEPSADPTIGSSESFRQLARMKKAVKR